MTSYTTWVNERTLELRGAEAHTHLQDDIAGLVSLRYTPVCITTGVHTGPVTITIDRLAQAPGEPDSSWQDVVEVSIRALEGEHVRVAGMWDDPTPPPPQLDLDGQEWIRVRIHASDRDAEFDLSLDAPSEHYLICAWPAAAASPRVLRAGSRIARRALAMPANGTPRTQVGVGLVLDPGESVEDTERRRRAEENLRRVDRAHVAEREGNTSL